MKLNKIIKALKNLRKDEDIVDMISVKVYEEKLHVSYIDKNNERINLTLDI